MSILIAILLIWICFFLGKCSLSFLRLKPEADQDFIFSSALGLGILSYFVLISGITGSLNHFTSWILILAPFLLSLPFAKRLIQIMKQACLNLKISIHFQDLLIAALSLMVLICLLAGLKTPETSNDSLCYHLHLPKVFLANQHIGKVPFEINSLFPFFMEMLYTLGLGLGSVSLAKFFHFYAGILGTFGIMSISRKYVSNRSAWIAGLIFFTTPGIVNQIASTYVDVAYASYSFLTLYALALWMQTEKKIWLFVAGLLMGLTLGIKYLGAITFLASLLTIIIFSISKRNFRLTLLMIFIAGAILSGAYWYLRAWVEWGNPVYPYFAWLFGSGDRSIHYDDIGVSKTFLNFIKIPWTITMSPQTFEGFGDNIGPAYLAWVPGLFIFRKSLSPFKFWIFYAIFYLTAWFLLGQSLRFLFPILPVLALLSAISIEDLFKRCPSWISTLLISVVFLIHSGLALYHYRGDFNFALGRESREHYLASKERSFEIATYVNQNLPTNAKILNAEEVHQFYFDRPLVREALYSRDSHYETQAKNLTEVIERLRLEGFTHILSATSTRQDPNYAPLRIPQILKEPQNLLALSVRPLYTCEFKEKDGTIFTYTLYTI